MELQFATLIRQITVKSQPLMMGGGIWHAELNGGTWSGYRKIITESEFDSSSATISDFTEGVDVYDETILRKNSAMVLGNIMLELNSGFASDDWITLCKVSPAPLKTENTIGYVNSQSFGAISQVVKVRLEVSGNLRVVFSETVSGGDFLFAPISYFYK